MPLPVTQLARDRQVLLQRSSTVEVLCEWFRQRRIIVPFSIERRTKQPPADGLDRALLDEDAGERAGGREAAGLLAHVIRGSFGSPVWEEITVLF